MAWVDVPGSNGIWEYENTAVITDTYLDSADGANSVISNGIRTWTRPGTSETLQCYIRCRTKIDSVERGELFKGYYDQILSSGGGIETITNVVSDAATTLQSWFDGADNNEFVPMGRLKEIHLLNGQISQILLTTLMLQVGQPQDLLLEQVF